MTDYYFSAPTPEALVAALAAPDPAPKYRFQATFANVITPVQGRAAVEATEDTPAQPAAGDPSRWYCCIRSYEAITPPESIEAVDPIIGAQVVGVWA